MNICCGMRSLSFKLEDRGLALPDDAMSMCHSNHGILLTIEISGRLYIWLLFPKWFMNDRIQNYSFSVLQFLTCHKSRSICHIFCYCLFFSYTELFEGVPLSAVILSDATSGNDSHYRGPSTFCGAFISKHALCCYLASAACCGTKW